MVFPELRSCKLSTQMAGTATVWHSHDMVQMGCLTEGRMRLLIPGTSLELGPGDFFLLAPGSLHRIENRQQETQYSAFVALEKAGAPWARWLRAPLDLGGICGTSCVARGDQGLRDQFERVVSMWEDTHPGSSVVAIGLMVRLLASLEGRALQELGQMIRSPHRQGGEARFWQALETIERRYRNPGFGVTEIADELHVSRSLLHRIFREAVGTGPQAYLCRYRVDRARDMILIGQHLVKEVADRTGFADVYSFSRAFKRIVGLSPARFLEQSRRSRSS